MCEFIQAFIEQKQEDDKWEYFIHKIWDKSYDEFCSSLQTSQDTQELSNEEIETTIKESMNILGNFSPEKEEGEVLNGFIWTEW